MRGWPICLGQSYSGGGFTRRQEKNWGAVASNPNSGPGKLCPILGFVYKCRSKQTLQVKVSFSSRPRLVN